MRLGDFRLQLLPEFVAQKNYCMAGLTQSLSVQMEPIEEFCRRVDHPFMNNINFMEIVREGSTMLKHISIDEVSASHATRYNQLFEEYKHSEYTSKWRYVISRNMESQF